MEKVLTVATRAGQLAIAQTNIVIGALKQIHPDIQIEIKEITTRGDRDSSTVLWNLKDSGFFTSQVEDALLTGEADFAVHSFKDLPTQQRDGLTIAAVCDRQFAEDCLLRSQPISSIKELPEAAKIGTSSLRRAAQLRRLRADLEAAPIRGNVTTRIRKLEEGKFDAIILARAGLERLGLGERISFVFDPAEFIPAPAQGALAVQIRSDDSATRKVIAAIDDKKARTITFAERQVLTSTQCGCHAPVGAFARIVSDDIETCLTTVEIRAFISDLEGKNFIERLITGRATDSDELAEKLANELLEAGGYKVLRKLEK